MATGPDGETRWQRRYDEEEAGVDVVTSGDGTIAVASDEHSLAVVAPDGTPRRVVHYRQGAGRALVRTHDGDYVVVGRGRDDPLIVKFRP